MNTKSLKKHFIAILSCSITAIATAEKTTSNHNYNNHSAINYINPFMAAKKKSKNNYYNNKPPFTSTVYIEPGLLTKSDHSLFTTQVYQGEKISRMYDRRTKSFNQVKTHVFTALYADSLWVTVQINSEFNLKDAEKIGYEYAHLVGQLPKVLRINIQKLWIHKGMGSFGGGKGNILIHSQQGIEYKKANSLEEIMLHEGVHSSLDHKHINSKEWQLAMKNDGIAISEYAKNNVNEDFAESFLAYVMLRYKPEKSSKDHKNIIRKTISHRIKYLDKHFNKDGSYK